MKKIILFLILIAPVFVKAQDSLTQLKNDTSLIAYKKLNEKIRYQLRASYYTIPSNMGALQSELMKDPSPKHMKEVLKSSGMAHSDEYVDDLVATQNLMLQFYKAHPQIMAMAAKEKAELLMKLLSSN